MFPVLPNDRGSNLIDRFFQREPPKALRPQVMAAGFIDILESHGLEGATIPRIAARAGVVPAGIYRRFKDSLARETTKLGERRRLSCMRSSTLVLVCWAGWSCDHNLESVPMTPVAPKAMKGLTGLAFFASKPVDSTLEQCRSSDSFSRRSVSVGNNATVIRKATPNHRCEAGLSNRRYRRQKEHAE
jgi:hypothetical protein